MSKKDNGSEKFYGVVTVGDRGQVVIPADARRQFGIDPGDKLLAINGNDDVIVLAKAEHIQEQLTELTKFIEATKDD